MTPFMTIPKWTAYKVKNFEQLYVRDESGRSVLNLATCALINYMPIVGITNITDVSKLDLWIRIATFQSINGSFYYFDKSKSKIPIFLTQDDINRHIGLETEGTNLTFQEFCNKWLTKNLLDHSVTPSYCANMNRTMLEVALMIKDN